MPTPNELRTLNLEAFSYRDRHGVLPCLTSALTECGGWLLERKTVSASVMEFHIELRLENILELYGSLLGTGVQLTRNTHATLTDLCTCRQNVEYFNTVGGTLTLRLVLNFLEELTLEELTLHALLATGLSRA